eukprot:969087-Rhodomonas_salina.2
MAHLVIKIGAVASGTELYCGARVRKPKDQALKLKLSKWTKSRLTVRVTHSLCCAPYPGGTI